MEYINRYEKLLQIQGVNFVRFENVLLREYNQIIIPLGPILIDKPKANFSTKYIFNKLSGKLVWWSYMTDNNSSSDWYGVVKDKHIKIEEYGSSNIRNQIRKGLKNCEIKRISFKELSENGFSVYSAAIKKHGSSVNQSMAKFKSSILLMNGFEDIIQLLGSF